MNDKTKVVKKFERSKITFEIYGEVYHITKPTFGRSLELAKAKDDMSEDGCKDAMIKLLDDLGLPEKVTMDMEIGHVSELMEYILPAKKK